MKKIFFLLLAFLYNLYAQNISISASVNKNRVSLNEQIVLQVTVSGDVTNLPSPTLPPLDNFTVYSSGRSQSISIINNQISSSITFNYILSPRSVGKFVIEPITITYKNQVYKTEPIEIEVVQAQPVQPQQPQPLPQPAPYTSRQPSDLLFLTAEVDKKTAYVGEQITLTIKFFCGTTLLSQPRYIPPEIVGFTTEDLPPQKQYYTIVDGRRYLVTEIKTALFPIKSGRFRIGSAQMECNIEDFSFDFDDFFSDDFFKRFFSRGKVQYLKTEPIEITVLPLPEQDKPKDFFGAVGEYNISAKLDKQKVEINQPVTLSITVSGKGDIKSVHEPKFPELSGIKRYQTLSSLNVSKNNYQVQGSKTFQIVMVPQLSGIHVIPEIQFSYFSPSLKSYRTIKTQSLRLEVVPSSQPQQVVQLPVIPHEGIKVYPQFIRHIKYKKLKDENFYFYAYEIYKSAGMEEKAVMVLKEWKENRQ